MFQNDRRTSTTVNEAKNTRIPYLRSRTTELLSSMEEKGIVIISLAHHNCNKEEALF